MNFKFLNRFLLIALVAINGELISSVESGAKGPVNEKGPEGDKGAKGPEGDKGAKGPEGDKGAKGPEGDKGAKGPEGDKGAKGPEGDKGAKGPEGDKGAKGPEGDKGKDGISVLITQDENEEVKKKLPSNSAASVASKTELDELKSIVNDNKLVIDNLKLELNKSQETIFGKLLQYFEEKKDSVDAKKGFCWDNIKNTNLYFKIGAPTVLVSIASAIGYLIYSKQDSKVNNALINNEEQLDNELE